MNFRPELFGVYSLTNSGVVLAAASKVEKPMK